MRRYVLTGGPCSGKTSTLNELSDRGYFVVKDPVRVSFRYNLPNRDIPNLRIYLEDHIPNLIQTVFCDGGLPTGLAYARFMGIPISEKYLKLCQNRNYAGVFFFDLLPKYRQEGLRRHNKKEAKKISALLYAAYTELGYKPIRVPVMPIAERADFVLSQIGESDKSL